MGQMIYPGSDNQCTPSGKKWNRPIPSSTHCEHSIPKARLRMHVSVFYGLSEQISIEHQAEKHTNITLLITHHPRKMLQHF